MPSDADADKAAPQTRESQGTPTLAQRSRREMCAAGLSTPAARAPPTGTARTHANGHRLRLHRAGRAGREGRCRQRSRGRSSCTNPSAWLGNSKNQRGHVAAGTTTGACPAWRLRSTRGRARRPGASALQEQAPPATSTTPAPTIRPHGWPLDRGQVRLKGVQWQQTRTTCARTQMGRR